MISGHILYSEMVNMKKIESFLVQAHWEKCVTHNSKLSHNKDCFLYRSSKSLFKVLEKMESWCLLWDQWSKTSQKKSLKWLHQPCPASTKVRYLYFFEGGAAILESRKNSLIKKCALKCSSYWYCYCQFNWDIKKSILAVKATYVIAVLALLAGKHIAEFSLNNELILNPSLLLIQ